MDNDEVELLVSRTLLPEANCYPWEFFADTIFAEQDFFQRSRRAAHSPVRNLAGRHAVTVDEVPQRVSYFYAAAATVRRRLQIQGYTRAFCEKAWTKA